MIEDFAQSHTNLLVRINALTDNLRTARLLGYSPRDIEDLTNIIKVFTIEKEQNIKYFVRKDQFFIFLIRTFYVLCMCT